MKAKDVVVGRWYGSLQVLEELPRAKGALASSLCVCVCVCGHRREITSNSLNETAAKVCRCKVAATNAARLRTHGQCRSKAYSSWLNMKQRCTNPNRPDQKNYVGRELGFCERWVDFPNFLEDMGEPPDGLTLERVDNSLGYSPGNCQWANSKQQNRNRRDTLYVEYRGERRKLADLIEESGLSRAKVYLRIHRRKWPVDRALETP